MSYPHARVSTQRAVARRIAVPLLAVTVAGRGLAAQGAPPDARPVERPVVRPVVRPVDQPVYRPVTLGDYATAVVGPRAVVRAVALAGFDQAVDRPSEWPTTGRGYVDRLGARAAERGISQAVVLGLSAARHERRADWAPCDCPGTGARVAHALTLPFRVDTREGRHLSPLVPMSELGSGILVTALYPRGFSVRDGVRGGATSLLFTELVSTAREFWPRRKR